MRVARYPFLLAAAAALSNNAKLSSLRCQWTELRNAAPSGRSGAACASGPSGAWLFGGLDDQRAVLDDLWHFDPAPKGGMGLRWRAVDGAGGERPGPRLCAAAAVVGGDFVVFGGWDMAAKKTLDDCWAHDGAAWRRVGSLPAPCKNHVAVGLGDRAVVVADGATYLYADGVVESFPQPTGRAPSARTMAAAARVGDDVLVFGGVSDGVELGDAYVLDVARMDWREVRTTGASPGPRAGASAATAAVAPSLPFVYGGARKVGKALEPLRDLWALDVDAGEWRLLVDGTAEEDAAPQARNAACFAPLDESTLLLTNGWQPLVRTFGDAFRLEVDRGD